MQPDGVEGVHSEMVNAKCTICGKSRPRGQCHIITLTEEEKTEIREGLGAEPSEEYAYCQPCWKNISDPRSGPAFVGSMYEISLRQVGVENAESAARKYRAWLTKQAEKKE